MGVDGFLARDMHAFSFAIRFRLAAKMPSMAADIKLTPQREAAAASRRSHAAIATIHAALIISRHFGYARVALGQVFATPPDALPATTTEQAGSSAAPIGFKRLERTAAASCSRSAHGEGILAQGRAAFLAFERYQRSSAIVASIVAKTRILKPIRRVAPIEKLRPLLAFAQP